MEATDIVGVVVGASTIGLLILVIVLFRSVYIVLTRKELTEKYTLNDALVEPERVEEKEAALV